MGSDVDARATGEPEDLPARRRRLRLRIRYGTTLDMTIPWDAVASIGVRHRDLPSSRTVQIGRLESGTVLHVGIASQTSVDVALRDPVTVRLPMGSERVAELRFHADDARALVACARQHVTPHL